MSPKPSSRKRFQKFLAARRQKLRRPEGGKEIYLARFKANPWGVFRFLLPPFAALVFYGATWGIGLFSPLFLWAHAAAAIILFVWFFAALRGSVGFWPRRGHLWYAVAFIACVGLGSSWGGFGSGAVKAWITPPVYARLPSVPLKEAFGGHAQDVLAGSSLHMSVSGDGPFFVSFGAEKRKVETSGEEEIVSSFVVPQDWAGRTVDLLARRGWFRLGSWRVRILPDEPPRIAFIEEPQITARKTIRLAYEVSDDYDVESVGVLLSPLSSGGKSAGKPEERILAAPEVRQWQGASYADLTSLPWAGTSVTLQLVATDGAGNKSFSLPKTLALPERAFRNPFARALIEERRKLLETTDPSVRDEAANIMAGIARQQGTSRGDPVVLMALRAGAVRLVINGDQETASSVREILWQTALRLEEGGIGLAQADLAVAERDLAFLLVRQANPELLTPFLARLRQAVKAYFAALEAERVRQPPALQQMDWLFAGENETQTLEAFEGLLTSLGSSLKENRREEAQDKLHQMQALIENLRTTPPELTPDQYRFVQQTAALRALARGQKSLLEETTKFAEEETKRSKVSKKQKDVLARFFSQQQLLKEALREVVEKIAPPVTLEAKASEQAMEGALRALQKKDMAAACQKQAEALALMENSLLALSEKMRQSLTAKAP